MLRHQQLLGVSLTGVAPSVAHVGGNEAPLVRGRVVKLHRGEVTGPVVSSDHVQQPINGTHTLSKKLHTHSGYTVAGFQ